MQSQHTMVSAKESFLMLQAHGEKGQAVTMETLSPDPPPHLSSPVNPPYPESKSAGGEMSAEDWEEMTSFTSKLTG